MGIPIETVVDLLRQEQVHYRDRRALVKVVRKKLHNITATYLEDLDYAEASGWLEALSPEVAAPVTREVCARIMSAHASTRERLPLLDTFYDRIFEVTGRPAVLLDLACGLHPFSFPWTGLPPECSFYAYDIHTPRVELVNLFFRRIGLQPLAEVRDVLVSPPSVPADIAFLFKEAHRMEKRRSGCSRPFWEALQVRYLAVSLPALNLSGDHDLTAQHRGFISQTVQGTNWVVHEVVFENELVFIIDKGTS